MADILYYYDGNFEWILYPIFWNIIYNNVCFLGTIPKSPSRCTFRNFIIFANKTFLRPKTHILGGTGDGEWWGREHWPAKPTWWTSPDLQARVALRTWSRWNLIFIFFKQSIIFVSYHNMSIFTQLVAQLDEIFHHPDLKERLHSKVLILTSPPIVSLPQAPGERCKPKT